MLTCPNCGGNLKFDIKSQMLGCEQCQTKMDPYSFEDKSKDAIEQDNFDVTIFSCPQCGGEILSTDTSAAEFCSFCGASTILYSRLSKEKRPNYIIPFQKTKEDCKKAYSNLMKRAIFAPDELKNPKYIDGFRGIYIPYWAFYITQQGGFSLNGSRSKRRGDYIYTDHYTLSGEIDAYYKGLSYDASSSFDDNLSAQIAPFDVKNMKEFTPAYLSGFYADTSDVDPALYENDARQIALNQSSSKIYKSFPNIDVARTLSATDLNTQTEAIDSTMFPVWFMSYRNGDRVAYATVNGQTGKVVTDLPVDIKKYTLGSLILSIPIFLLLNLLFTITPTVLLAITTALAVLCIILFGIELTEIHKKESGANDRGRIGAANAANTFTKQKSAVRNVFSSFTASIIAVLLGAAILFFQPVSDLFYYGGAIVSLIALFVTIKGIIRNYNVLATRRLPQFDRTGGDDRA